MSIETKRSRSFSAAFKNSLGTDFCAAPKKSATTNPSGTAARSIFPTFSKSTSRMVSLIGTFQSEGWRRSTAPALSRHQSVRELQRLLGLPIRVAPGVFLAQHALRHVAFQTGVLREGLRCLAINSARPSESPESHATTT